jgi:tRNA threonylcarbamoyladenosine biosynthesis protein TsaB
MILAINTSTLQFGVALLDEEGTVLAEYFMSEGRGHFGGLMPALNFLVDASNCNIQTLKCLAVAIGPGSFTGLRVGLSVAKGLCHALQIPIVGISSLEALASQLPYSHLPITSILDSRKGEFFAAQFAWDNGHELRRKGEDINVRPEDFHSMLEPRSIFVGNNFSRQGPLITERLGPPAELAPAFCWNVKASAVGSLALKRFNAQAYDDPHRLTPIYLRPPDIRPNPFPLLKDPM